MRDLSSPSWVIPRFLGKRVIKDNLAPCYLAFSLSRLNSSSCNIPPLFEFHPWWYFIWMRKTVALVLTASLSLVGIGFAQAANPKAGTKCPTANQKVTYSGKTFTCIKSGNKLIWNKGVYDSKNSQQPSNSGGKGSTSTPSSGGDELESLPIDPVAPLKVDLKGAGQGKGLTYVPFGFNTGPRGQDAIGSGSVNPQPVLYAPIGTVVLAIKTGTVIKISKLWSNDYNIMIAAENDKKNIWGLEHVIDVKVKEGDKVKAGQPIAKVGDFDERYTPGIGLVEFGLLINSSGPPSHICPFKKIAPSAKSRITSELTAIIAADKKRGYDSGPMEVIGCTALVSVEG